MAMAKITVVAKVVAKQDAIAAVKKELLKLIEPTRNESGCIGYKLHQDNSDPALFIFYETWESAACLEKHMNTDHFKSYIKAVDGMLAEKAVNKLTLIE
jgi:quinol monooxygenase YgiN